MINVLVSDTRGSVGKVLHFLLAVSAKMNQIYLSHIYHYLRIVL